MTELATHPDKLLEAKTAHEFFREQPVPTLIYDASNLLILSSNHAARLLGE